jgi:elongation factor Ts
MTNKEQLLDLRRKTGCGMQDCLAALNEADGDMDKAIEVLRKKGLKTAAKRADRSASEGVITSYIHAGGKVGVLLELNCETDFVARNEQFQSLAHDISMHIAASVPECLAPEDVPHETIVKEKEILREQLIKEGKPEEMLDGIIEGKITKYYAEHCLLKQQYIKDDTKTIEALLTEAIGSLGENITVGRFARFALGA